MENTRYVAMEFWTMYVAELILWNWTDIGLELETRREAVIENCQIDISLWILIYILSFKNISLQVKFVYFNVWEYLWNFN
jgi:hypothetical protein